MKSQKNISNPEITKKGTINKKLIISNHEISENKTSKQLKDHEPIKLVTTR